MIPAESKENPLLKKGNFDAFFKEKYLTKNIQGRWMDAHLILGMSFRQIAQDKGVSKSAVRDSIHCGLERMKKYLRKNF